MPVYKAPFGFQPAKLIGSQYYANAQESFPIQSGYATALRPGDLVRINAAGYLAKETGTATYLLNGGGILGVFLGCHYTDSVLGHTYRQNWTAGTTPVDQAYGYVAADPDLIFRVAYVSGTTVISPQTQQAVLNKNVAIVQNAVSTTTSDIAVSGVNTTATLPFRVIDVDFDSGTAAAGYTAVFVTYNATMHTYLQPAPATV